MTAINPNHPAFDSYRRRLKGEKLPLREGEPEAGFYRYKSRPIDTIAIIMPNGNDAPWELVCAVGVERREMNPVEVWAYIAGRHVSPAIARQVLETGQWPDAAPAPAAEPKPESKPEEIIPQAKGSVLGDNAKAAGVGPVEEALAYLEVADAFLKSLSGKIEDELTANKAANCRDKLASFSGDKGTLKVAHTEEKRPHLEKCREIDEKYLRVIDRLKEKHAEIGRPLKVYLDAKQAAAAAAAAAERKRLEAEAAAKQQKAIEEARARLDEETANQIAAVPIEALVAAMPGATAMAVKAEKVQVGGQVSGRKTTLKKKVTYEIEDYDKALAAVKDHPDVREVVQQVVNRLSQAGAMPPGVKKVDGTRL